jgi:anti-anti-sigma factor
MSEVGLSPITPFEITVVPNRDEVGVIAAGELDIATAPALAQEAGDVQAAGFRHVVIDLHQVDFIDSTGLRMLLDLRAELERNGGRLTLVPPLPGAQRIFELTGTRRLFDWRDRFGA